MSDEVEWIRLTTEDWASRYRQAAARVAELELVIEMCAACRHKARSKLRELPSFGACPEEEDAPRPSVGGAVLSDEEWAVHPNNPNGRPRPNDASPGTTIGDDCRDCGRFHVMCAEQYNRQRSETTLPLDRATLRACQEYLHRRANEIREGLDSPGTDHATNLHIISRNNAFWDAGDELIDRLPLETGSTP